MERFVPNMKKAMEDREEKPKVPSREPEPSLSDLVSGEQPQLQSQHQPPNISEMKPLTREAYGGGMYAHEAGPPSSKQPRASVTQSADGPEEALAAATTKPDRQSPPSTGDRDLDITGQSYIQ